MNSMEQQGRGSVREFLYKHVTGIDITAGVLIALLVMSTVFYAVRYNQLNTELARVNAQEQVIKTNEKALGFLELFVEKVLSAEGEIDFETRLNLESAVRALEDPEILAIWQRFTESNTESQAQQAVKELLSALIAQVQ